jgi:HD-GYP domain-containing protein (c-di-GMP phosphodiesterase class II)
MSSPSLSASINRALLTRLIAASIALCVLFGTLGYFNEQQRIEKAVAELARLQSQRFNQHILDILDATDALSGPLVQESLESFIQEAGPSVLSDGRFVLVRIYDSMDTLLAELSDNTFVDLGPVRQAVDAAELTPLAPGDFRVVSARLSGAAYVGAAVPLVNRNNETRAQLIGVFALSDSAIARIRGGLLRTLFYVAGIVFATAAIIYPIILGLINRLSRQSVKLLDSNLEILQVLGGAIAKRDSDTDAHNYRVSVYSVCLAEAVGLPRKEIKGLIKGALLHDVGKLGIRDDILLKPGKLSADEFTVMKTHVEHGMDITARASWLEDAQSVVGGHHEKFDGGGYPGGISGESIPITARIFAITDVFDALTSKRPYKEPMSFEKTMQIMQSGRGHHFDPDLLDAFTKIARELYDTYSSKDDAAPKQRLETMTDKYFKGSVADLLA